MRLEASRAGADFAALRELFAVFGPVALRRMFGGVGIYADGVMFALTYDGTIYLKADEAMAEAFRKRGSQPFTYMAKAGKRVVMSYWALPQSLYDDGDELARWARQAVALAHRRAAREKAAH